MAKIAKLDEKGRLVGYLKKAKPAKGDIDVGEACDLPTDGTYKWDAGRQAFVPRGHGLGKPKRPSIAEDFAVYLLMRALVRGEPIPDTCARYVDWYEQHRAKMHEELTEARDIRNRASRSRARGHQ